MGGSRSKNGEERHGGGGGVIHSKVNLAPQKMQKPLTFDSMSQKSSASVLQKWHKIEFLLNFHVCCFSNNRYE